MEDQTIICRCEDVTWGEIREQLDKGYTTLDEIKRITRTGMGLCQGKTCQRVLLHAMSRYLNKRVEDIEISTFRQPAKPIKLKILAGEQND